MIIASSAKGPVWSRWGLGEKASLVICALRVRSGLGSWLGEASVVQAQQHADCPGRPTMSLQSPGPPPLHCLIPLAISTRITPHSSPPPPKSLVSPPDLHPPPSNHTRVPHSQPRWVTGLSPHRTTPFISMFPHPAQCWQMNEWKKKRINEIQPLQSTERRQNWG